MSYQPSTLGRIGHKLDLPKGDRLEDYRSSATGAARGSQHRLALDWPSTPAPTHANDRAARAAFPSAPSVPAGECSIPDIERGLSAKACVLGEKEHELAANGREHVAKEGGHIEEDCGCTTNPQEFTANPHRFAETEHGFASKERGLPVREHEFQLKTLPCFLISQSVA